MVENYGCLLAKLMEASCSRFIILWLQLWQPSLRAVGWSATEGWPWDSATPWYLCLRTPCWAIDSGTLHPSVNWGEHPGQTAQCGKLPGYVGLQEGCPPVLVGAPGTEDLARGSDVASLNLGSPYSEFAASPGLWLAGRAGPEQRSNWHIFFPWQTPLLHPLCYGGQGEGGTMHWRVLRGKEGGQSYLQAGQCSLYPAYSLSGWAHRAVSTQPLQWSWVHWSSQAGQQGQRWPCHFLPLPSSLTSLLQPHSYPMPQPSPRHS